MTHAAISKNYQTSFFSSYIALLISQWNAAVGGILFGILVIYLIFFEGRAIGLLHSDR